MAAGRPPVAGREEQRRFWKAIARGLSSEDAAVLCGVSPPVGGSLVPWGRWDAADPAWRPDRLRSYVQDRLAGTVMAEDGTPVPGPHVGSWRGRRRGARSRSPIGSG